MTNEELMPKEDFYLYEDFHSYVVYFDTTDFPGKYVVRKFNWDKPTGTYWVFGTIKAARQIIPRDMSRLCRHKDDDNKIIETWI